MAPKYLMNQDMAARFHVMVLECRQSRGRCPSHRIRNKLQDSASARLFPRNPDRNHSRHSNSTEREQTCVILTHSPRSAYTYQPCSKVRPFHLCRDRMSIHKLHTQKCHKIHFRPRRRRLSRFSRACMFLSLGQVRSRDRLTIT